MSDTANNVEAFEAFHLEKVGVEAGPWENGRFVFDRVHERWEFWLSSRRQALEEAAAIAESRIVADKEAELKARAAEAKGKSEKEELAALNYWLGVSAHNASHRNLASAIRREAEGK